MEAIIFFTKVPIENFSKTRLLPYLKPSECKELQEILIKDIADELRKYQKYHKIVVNDNAEKTSFNEKNAESDIFVFYTPKGECEKLKSFLPDIDALYYLQEGENIFDKMENAFDIVFKMGYKRAILVGSDIFDLGANDFAKAFLVLKQKDIVIGETFDGGYYLIGMKNLKRGILSVNSNKVFDDTIKNFEKNNLSFGTVEKKRDIDIMDDLKRIYPLLQGKESRLKLFLDKIELIKKEV